MPIASRDGGLRQRTICLLRGAIPGSNDDRNLAHNRLLVRPILLWLEGVIGRASQTIVDHVIDQFVHPPKFLLTHLLLPLNFFFPTPGPLGRNHTGTSAKHQECRDDWS